MKNISRNILLSADLDFLKTIKQTYKFTFVFALILSYVVTAVLAPKKYLNAILKKFSGWALSVLNIRIKIEGELPTTNKLFVSNHMSYIDVLLLSSIYKTHFVTSVEIKESFGLGYLTELANCLFVERRNKQNLQGEIHEITNALKMGHNVTVFPEATSTNGEGVLRFRKPLFFSAILSKREIQPVCINVTKIDGEKFDTTNRDKFCWYGDMEFIPHLWDLAGCSKINVTINFLNTISTTVNSEIENLAEESFTLVKNCYKPCI